MNYHKRVLQFILVVFSFLFVLSFVPLFFKTEIKTLQNISILSDVIKSKDTANSLIIHSDAVTVTTVDGAKKFSAFSAPQRVTAYYTDTNNINLKKFIAKLTDLKKGKRKKIRIAYLGDSMIEDDFISSTLRSLMQQQFGGYGVGYLPMSSALTGNRTTAQVISSATWIEHNFRNNPSKNTLFVSGRNFIADGTAFAEIKDKTAAANLPLNKYLLYGNSLTSTVMQCNNSNVTIPAALKFNTVLLDSSINSSFKISIGAGLSVFGVSSESPTGVIVDNFSFRGNSGQEFAGFDSVFLQTINKLHTYDLIIMQYGVNLFDKPSDVKFDWYYQPMKKSVAKLKACFSEADIVLLGCADRSFRYDNEYASAKGLPVIINMQQKIAFENGIHFYNTFESMGGNGSMINWVKSKPALAYKDYMHPNAAGSALMGKGIFNAIMIEYNKFLKTSKQ
jgi:lysophospholipase L1-like esterase